MQFNPFSAVSLVMDAKDRSYYLRRALQEEEAARVATCDEARERHEELAAAYRLRCRLDATPDESDATPVLNVVHFAA